MVCALLYIYNLYKSDVWRTKFSDMPPGKLTAMNKFIFVDRYMLEEKHPENVLPTAEDLKKKVKDKTFLCHSTLTVKSPLVNLLQV